MKKAFWFLPLFLLFSLTSCSSAQYVSDLERENEELSLQAAEMSAKIDVLEKEADELEKEVDELKNGASRRIATIRDAYSKNDYETVIRLYAELKALHPGSDEAIEADELVKEIEKFKVAEQKKIAAEAAKSASDKVKSVIRVKSIYPSKPNSAGGVDLHIIWQNKSDKVIKYADFTVEPYNAVEDVVRCTIRGKSLFCGRETGPIESGQWQGNDGYCWECAWYNNTIKRTELVMIKLEYMDGSIYIFKDDDINYAKY